MLSELETAIHKAFGVKYDLKSLVSKRLLMHQGYVTYFTKLLKKVNPKMVFVVVAYQPASFGLINAAKLLNIPVAELQHGTIFKYHMGYSFPNGTFISNCTPDYIYSFGEYWRRQVTYALPESRITSIGYPFFSKMVDKFSSKANPKKILFISQGTIGGELYKFAIKLKNILPEDYSIDYKLHSAEYPVWKEKYLAGNEASPFNIIDNDKINLYQLIAEAEYVIGVYSTALYEAIGFGKKVYLVNIAGVDSMNTLIEANRNMLINTPEDFKMKLKNKDAEGTMIDKDFIFNGNWKSNFKAATEAIAKTNVTMK